MKHKSDWESLYRMSPVDQICYKYYQTTGQYLQDPDPQTIRLLLQSWPFYAQAQKMLPTEELLHRGETAKLEELFQWEQLGFVENSDVFVARVVRYCITPMHLHHYFELQCVLRGNAVYLSGFGKRKLKQYDIVLVPPNVSHQLIVESGGTVITVSIRNSTFHLAFREIMENQASISRYFQTVIYGRQKRELFFAGGIDHFVTEMLQAIYCQQQGALSNANKISVHLTQAILYYVAQNCSASLIFEKPDYQDSRIWEIEMYLMEHYQDISLQQLARQFHFSTTYLSRLLYQNWGIGFAQGLQRIRLHMAENLLRSTDLSITDICRQVGYENDSYFIRIFKRAYGLTPGQYRKQSFNAN